MSAWLADVIAAKGTAEVARLKKHRHEILAHNAASSKVPKVQPMRYVDPRRVLEKTIPIVSSGYRLATGRTHDFSTTVAMWKNRQSDLWEVIRCAARGEQFAPAPRTLDDLAQDLRAGGSIEISG